jgi:hypothetical protein
MAHSSNGVLGEFRGKLGNIVGSRNAAGAIIRKKTIPKNPKTIAQRNARTRFATATAGWKTVSLALRQNWEVFAKAGFNPLRKINRGQLTGANAYQGIQSSISGSNFGLSLPSVGSFSTAIVLAPVTGVPIAVSNVAPVNTVQSNIYDATVGSYPMTLISAQLTTAGLFCMDIRFTGVGATPPVLPKWIDGKSKPFGFMVYFSEPLTFVGKRAANALSSQIGFTGIFPNTAIGTAPVPGARITFSGSAQIANWKKAPALGNIYQATVVVVGNDGTQMILGKAFLTVAATLTAGPAT